MDCQKCHELLSDFLDDSLTGDDHRLLGAHLKECLTCAGTHREMDELVALARTDFAEHYAPRDSQNLWLRIREQVEGDMDWARTAASHSPRVKSAVTTTHENWWSRLWNARWEVSAPHAAAFASLMLVAAMVGAFSLGVRRMEVEPNVTTTTIDPALTGATMRSNFVEVETVRPRQASLEDFVRQRQAEAQYWMQRVETRKARFTPQLRDSYERSLASLDQTVADSLDELRRNPQDEISVETLNVALQEKSELLKEFSQF